MNSLYMIKYSKEPSIVVFSKFNRFRLEFIRNVFKINLEMALSKEWVWIFIEFSVFKIEIFTTYSASAWSGSEFFGFGFTKNRKFRVGFHSGLKNTKDSGFFRVRVWNNASYPSGFRVYGFQQKKNGRFYCLFSHFLAIFQHQ